MRTTRLQFLRHEHRIQRQMRPTVIRLDSSRSEQLMEGDTAFLEGHSAAVVQFATEKKGPPEGVRLTGKDPCKKKAVITVWIDKSGTKDNGCSKKIVANGVKALKKIGEELAKLPPFKCCQNKKGPNKCELTFGLVISEAKKQPKGAKKLQFYCTNEGLEKAKKSGGLKKSDPDYEGLTGFNVDDPSNEGGIIVVPALSDWAARYLSGSLRARSKITSHSCIPSSHHLRSVLNRENLRIH